MKNDTTDMVSQGGILQWWVISMSSGKRLAGKFIPNNLLWHTRPRACKKQQSGNQCWVVWSWPLCAVRFYAAPVDLEAQFHRSQGIYTETSYSVVRAAHSLPSPPLYCCMKTLERLFTETGEWKRCYDTAMLWHLKEQSTQKFKFCHYIAYTHQHAVPSLYDFLFFCGTQNIFGKYPGHSFPYNECEGLGM